MLDGGRRFLIEPDRSKKERFEALLAATGIPLASLTPQMGLDLMLHFYQDHPDAGFLTCAWSSVTHYGAEEVGLFITHHTYPHNLQPGGPPDLYLIFRIGPRDMIDDFSGIMTWCEDPDQRANFRATVEGAPAFQDWGQVPAAGVALLNNHEGLWTRDLFDCWGARDPSRPVVSMTEEQWLRSDDVWLMLLWFRQQWQGDEANFNRLVHRYYLACCRKIWRLLPQEASRSGVEVAERFANGQATKAEVGRADWFAEAAALKLDLDLTADILKNQPDMAPQLLADAQDVERWCEEFSQIPPHEFAAMIHWDEPEEKRSPREWLEHAAYFAIYLMGNHGLESKESIVKYRCFLPTSLLREVVGNPFRMVGK